MDSSFSLDVWQCRDEHNNFEQKFDAELVKEAKRYMQYSACVIRFLCVLVVVLSLKINDFFVALPRIEVEIEVRKNVDELMREELKNLKMVCGNATNGF